MSLLQDAKEFGDFFKRNHLRKGYLHFRDKARRNSYRFLHFFFPQMKRAYISAVIYKCRFLLILGKWQEAREEMKKVMNKYAQVLEDNQDLKAEILHNQGELHFYLSSYQKSVEYTEHSFRIKKDFYHHTSGTGHVTKGQTLVVQGKAYWKKGDYYEALTCYYQAISYYYQHKAGGIQHLIGRTMCLIGQVYMDLTGLDDKAIRFLEKSRNLLTAHLHEHHLYLGAVYNELGKGYMRIGKDLNKANAQFDLALEILEKTFDNLPHRYKASVIGNKADLLSHQRTATQAHVDEADILGLLQAELAMRKASFNNISHSSIARTYNKISQFYNQAGQFEKAITMAQHSLQASIKDFDEPSYSANPKLSQIEGAFSPLRVLQALEKKAMGLFQSYKKKQEESILHDAHETIALAVEVEQQIRESLLSDESWLAWGEKALQVYELAIEILFTLKEKGKPVDQEILLIFHRSKAALLLKNINNPVKTSSPWKADEDKNEANALLEIEKWLLKDEGILTSPASQKKFDDLELFLKKRKEHLRQVRQTKEGEADYVENKGENWDDEKAQLSIPNLFDELQEGPPGMIISYFVGEKRIYILLISGKDESFKLKEASYEGHFESLTEMRMQIKELLFFLNSYDPHDTGISLDDDVLDRKKLDFVMTNDKLYKLLIHPIKDDLKGCERLYFIPADALTLLPFEILAPIPPRFPQFNYRDLDYLIRKHKISYHTSIAVLYKNHCKPEEEAWKAERRKVKAQKGTLSKIKLFSIATAILRGKSFRSQDNQPLERGIDTLAEILEIDQKGIHIYYNRNELNGNGIQNRIIGEMECSDIIHFFGHSTTETMLEDAPALVLLEKQDRGGHRKHTELLTQKNIANQSIIAELTILNTCLGGWGRITSGEGPATLSYAFLRAGGRNIYFTFFKIKTDFARSMIKAFITNTWEHGMDYVTALQQAKLNFIDGPDPDTSHPACWAGPAFIGNQLGKLSILEQ